MIRVIATGSTGNAYIIQAGEEILQKEIEELTGIKTYSAISGLK